MTKLSNILKKSSCMECGKPIGDVQYIRYGGVCITCWHKLND